MERDYKHYYYIIRGSVVEGDKLNIGLKRKPGEDVGEYEVSMDITDEWIKRNYKVTVSNSADAKFTITPREVSGEIVSQTKTYGEKDPDERFTHSAIAEGDTLDYTITREGEGKPDGENVKYKDSQKEELAGYAYQLTWGDNPNYSLGTITEGSLTIEPFPFTITADSLSKSYGEKDPALTASLSPKFPDGFPETDRDKALEDIVRYSVKRETKKDDPQYDDAGQYAINVTIDSCSDNYKPEKEPGIFSINKRSGDKQTVVIDIGTYSKQYKDSDPAYKGTITGLLEADKGTVEWEVERADKDTPDGEKVGKHPLTAKITKDNPNYEIIVNPGNLDIKKRVLSLTPETQRITYSPEPEPEEPEAWKVSADNLAVDDKLSDVVAYTLERERGYDVKRDEEGSIGYYPITIKEPKLKGGYADCYELNLQPGKFYVKPMEVSLTATSDPVIYGELAGEPQVKLARAGEKKVPTELAELKDQVARYSQSGAPMAGTQEGKNAGTYVLKLADEKVLEKYTNYDITFVPGAFTIQKKDLTLTPKNVSITYGDTQADELFELDEKSYDTAYNEALNNIIVYNFVCENDGSAAGSPYPITVELGGQKSENYSIKTGTAELTIGKKPVTITMNKISKIYGDEDPALVPNIPELVGGDKLDVTLEREAGSDVGGYKVSIAGMTGDADNYEIELSAPDFEIEKRPVKVAAGKAGKVYGDKDPALTAAVTGYDGNASSGLVNGDKLSYDVERADGEVVRKDGYPITVKAPESVEGSTDKDYDNKNYDIETADSTFTITPATLTVKAADASKIYGDLDPDFKADISGLKRSDKESEVIDGIKVEREDTGEDAGGQYKLKVTAYNLKTDNYTVATGDGKFTIFQKADGIQISVGTAYKTYGEEDPDWNSSKLKEQLVTFEGLRAGERLNYTLTREPGNTVGTYAIGVEVSQESNPNFDVSKINIDKGLFTINKRQVTVSAKDNKKVYGDEDPALEAEVLGAVDIGNTGDEMAYSAAREPGENVRPGGYVITPTVTSENPNYQISTETGLFTIAPKHIEVTTSNKDKVYGDEDPEFEIVMTDGTPAPGDMNGTTDRTQGEDAGDYETTVKTDNPNYDVAVVPGRLTIHPRELTMTVDDKEQVYGDAEKELTAAVVGFVERDQADADKLVTYKLERAAGKDAGDYPISVKDLKVDKNYKLEGANGNYKITPRAITLKNADLSKIYGDMDPDMQGSVKVPDEIAGKGLAPVQYQASREDGEDAGSYPVTVTLGDNPNYDITVDPAQFRITPKEVTVNPDTASKIYGDADPAWGAKVSGLVGQDTLSYELRRQDGEDAGDYKLLVVPGQNPNYTLENREGTFTIHPAAIQISADNKVMTYGSEEPELTAQVTGLKRGDNALDVVKYELTRESGSNAGTYKITPSVNDSSRNYTVTTVEGTLTITPRDVDVVVAADNAVKTYGEDDPVLTAAVSGVLDGDTLDYTVTREPGEDVRLKADGTLGGYPIHVAVQNNPNYNVQTVEGTFTIVPRSIAVTTDPENKVYGDADPKFNITTPDGLPLPDDLGGTAQREPGEDAGSYDVTVKVDNPNYAVDVITRVFEITPKDIVLRASDAEKYAGAQDPVLTVNEIAGLVGDDTIDYTVSREPGEDVGTYGIIPAVKGTYNNYNIRIENGIFTIRDAQQSGFPVPIVPPAPGTTLTPAPAGPAAFGTLTPAALPAYAGGTALTLAPAEAPTVIDAQGNSLGTQDEYLLSQLPEEGVPLANQKLPEDHRCCILHFLLLLLALLLEGLYTRSMKKRQRRIHELEMELACLDASKESEQKGEAA